MVHIDNTGYRVVLNGIMLMAVFFVGLSLLEVIHIVLLGSWNEVVFNGIMLVAGTLVGAVGGRQNS